MGMVLVCFLGMQPTDTPRWRPEQHLWKLPAVALIAPLVIAALAIVLIFLGAEEFAPYLGDLLVRFWYLSPALGLLTLFILAAQYSMFWSELDFGRIGPRHIVVLALLAVVSPVWLFVLYFLAGGGR